jgi:hypothetical protein
MDKKNIGFKLLSLKTEQFATFEENYQERINEAGLLVNANWVLNIDNKQIGVFTTFSFDHEKKVFLKIQVSCHFEVTPQSWDEYCEEKKITFPKGFIQHITTLAIGSTRGVLHAKTEGTVFNKYLIPTIDVTKMVKKDVEFSISQ